jgi:hypothetical protein
MPVETIQLKANKAGGAEVTSGVIRGQIIYIRVGYEGPNGSEESAPSLRLTELITPEVEGRHILDIENPRTAILHPRIIRIDDPNGENWKQNIEPFFVPGFRLKAALEGAPKGAEAVLHVVYG